MKIILQSKRIARAALFFAVALTAGIARGGDGLVVHEWGTFTSVQGGDGRLVPWQASQIGDLPKFVHHWMQNDLNRQAPMFLFFGKGGLTSLQRMETPVIYFYSDKEMAADVTVGFPKGYITEWYPQAAQLGPSTPSRTNGPTAHVTTNSLIRWQDVKVMPANSRGEFAARLPMDTNGSHYFAARETDAALLRVNDFAPTNATEQLEKFLFYRGSGNFATPLTVSVGSGNTVVVTNTGSEALKHLFLLQVENGMAEWTKLDKLNPGEQRAWQQLNPSRIGRRLPMKQFQAQIGGAMVSALTESGLYPAESKAMVKTWTDAWFAEEGVRVLYVLPRQWTDEILPLTLSPQPRELVRVMVGRSEIITPESQNVIAAHLQRSDKGDAESRKWLDAYAKKFGRFAPPAFQLARQSLARPENKPVANPATTAYIP